MPFVTSPAEFQHPRPFVASLSGYKGIQHESGGASRFGITRQALTVFPIGKTRYHLKNSTEGIFYPSSNGIGEFIVESFGDNIVGKGMTPTESCNDWINKFHVTFQTLYVKQAFEFNAEDKRMWGMIESLVDVERFRKEQPLVVRQEGRVHRIYPYPVIKWEDGTTEKVRLFWMPPEFASFKIGQRFETVIERNPITHKIQKVSYVKRLPSIKISKEESNELWHSIQTSESLPDSTWD